MKLRDEVQAVKLSANAETLYRLQQYDRGEQIDGVTAIALRRFNDDGGSMMELIRLGSASDEALAGFAPAQINYSTLHPAVTKAFHVHRQQTDVWFVPPEDRVLLVLVDVRDRSATEGRKMRLMLGDGNTSLVRIPPGVAHGCRNLGDRPARIIYFTDRLFSADPEACDEGRLPWDFVGKDVWDVTWE